MKKLMKYKEAGGMTRVVITVKSPHIKLARLVSVVRSVKQSFGERKAKVRVEGFSKKRKCMEIVE